MPSAEPESSSLSRALDFLSDWTLLSYAVWTLLAYLGMATGARVSILVPAWLATVPLAALALVVLGRRTGGPPSERVPASGEILRGSQRLGYLLGAGIALALVSAVLAGTTRGQAWPVVWGTAVLAFGFISTAALLRPERAEGTVPPLGRLSHLFAVCVGFALAVMSLFLNRGSADDVFYVNRATATAQLNRIPVRDVLVTNEQVDPASGVGLPVDSFSALQGAMARLFDVAAPSIAYYVTPPLFTFLAVWALWRLLRLWASRATTVCFAVGVAYLLFSAQFNLTAGSFFLNRMWQGKVIFVAWLVPTLYVLLTKWLARHDGATALLLLAAGVSSIGLTGSATFAVPLIFATAGLALLVRRYWPALALVAGAASIPFVIGFAATRVYPLSDALSGHRYGPPWFFHSVFGVGLVCALGLLGLWAAPWLVRPGPPALIAAGIGAVTILLLAPGFLPALTELAGIQGALRRTLWVVPLPAVVGLLASVRVGGWMGRRWSVAVPAAALVALLIGFGQPLWDSHTQPGQSFWTSRPLWKTSQGRIAEARTILSRYHGPGPILADEPIMAAISLVTVQPKAVNPRRWYIRLTGEPQATKEERIRLTAFVAADTSELPRPSPQQVREDLTHLQVDLVCVDDSLQDVIREVEAAGPYEPAFRARGHICLERNDSAA